MIRKLRIGGKERAVSFNMNCLEEFEEMTGINALNGVKINAKSTKALIFCGLKYGEYPEGIDNDKLDFDLKKVGSWLDPSSIAAAMAAFNSQSEPEQQKKTEPEPASL